tara:strand:+ start:858 stop:1793 length:936 start_codon:yes stop_codon:yes gene_type:complete
MFKLFTLIYFFIGLCFSSLLLANDDYRILIRVDNKIITNYDIEKEKNYLSALNPKILNISENEIRNIAKQSLIREIIKEKEVLKYYDVDYQSPNLILLAKNLYTRLNISSEENFKVHLEKHNLDLKHVLKKLAIESNWNSLIYTKYKDQVSIDRDKIKKNLQLESLITREENIFLLSEILFTVENKEEYNEKYNKILETINEKGFKYAATIYSTSDTAKFGGEIGWISKNDISQKIYKQVSILKKNAFTKPIKIGTGFLLISLDGKKKREKKNNLNENFKNIVNKETNRQLNQYSNIYFKKIKNRSFIYED